MSKNWSWQLENGLMALPVSILVPGACLYVSSQYAPLLPTPRVPRRRAGVPAEVAPVVNEYAARRPRYSAGRREGQAGRQAGRPTGDSPFQDLRDLHIPPLSLALSPL